MAVLEQATEEIIWSYVGDGGGGGGGWCYKNRGNIGYFLT
jgi:hypothetical protein